MPTPEEKQKQMEEHVARLSPSSSRYFLASQPTYIENWPSALCSLSIPQAGLRLSLDQAERLGKNMTEFGAAFYPGEKFPEDGPPQIADIVTNLETIVQKNLGGTDRLFVRLGSRSPKDAWVEGGPMVENADQAIERLCGMSERVFEDISMALHEGYDPYIWLRQWIDIEPWSEFRCFQKDRKLVGISEYDYLGSESEEIMENHDAIEWAIRRFWEQQFLPACHLDSVIFDVYLTRKPGMSTRDIRPDTGKPSYQSFIWEVRLLEINPYFNLTDPCLFDWRDDDCFDGSFRFRVSEPKQGFGRCSVCNASLRLRDDGRLVTHNRTDESGCARPCEGSNSGPDHWHPLNSGYDPERPCAQTTISRKNVKYAKRLDG
jgi:hypothetical protein